MKAVVLGLYNTFCDLVSSYPQSLFWYNIKIPSLLFSCPGVASSLRAPIGSFVHGISQTRILEWVAFPSPGDLHDPGINPWSPSLQADSLPSKPSGKTKLCSWRLKASENLTKCWGRIYQDSQQDYVDSRPSTRPPCKAWHILDAEYRVAAVIVFALVIISFPFCLLLGGITDSSELGPDSSLPSSAILSTPCTVISPWAFHQCRLNLFLSPKDSKTWGQVS